LPTDLPTIEGAQQRLQAAGLLIEHGFHSDAVSRAYYAAHQAERIFLARQDHYPKTHRGAHNLLRQRLRDTGRSHKLAGKLDRLQRRRQECDYNGHEPSQQETAEVLDRAESIVTRLITLMEGE
jgi:uncharacterized protein (UPF0332 family)